MSFMMMKKIYFLALIALACGSNDDAPEVKPPNEGGYKQYGTPYGDVPVVDEVVLYEVNTRAFSSTADFQGVIDKLDHIKSLGVNTIWLMPIHPVGQVKSAGGLGSPYAVKNYLEVNTEFGNLAKLRELVEKAHNKNMAVILDWVANHTAWDNPWIQNKSWYTQDAGGNIIIPPGTNWQDVAELNYNNSDMRKAMIDAMKYWVLEANVDGFRCDAVDFVPSDFWKQALDHLKAIEGRELILLAEGGKPENFTAGFQMNYAWDFYNNLKQVYGTGKSAASVFSTHLAEYSSIPAGARKLRYTTNHDESAWEATPVSLFGGKNGALSASVITIFTSAVPMIYGSQEVGQTEVLPFFTQEPIDWSANQDMLEEYETLFSIYNGTDVFIKGTLQYFDNADFAVFKRAFGGEEYLIIVNVRNGTKVLTLDNSLKNTTWTDTANNVAKQLENEVSLGAYEYLILKK
jgi:glycosidase